MRRWRWPLIVLALLSVALSLINASWIAPIPPGRLDLIADGGIGQRSSPGAESCEARRIVTEEGNNYIENTLPSLYKALKLGAQSVAIPIQRTRDGAAIAFADPALDCRTDGKGRVADLTLEEIKRLDAGHGYSPDGGRSFPLRGRGIGAIPTVEEVLRYIPTAGIVFVADGEEPAKADALVGAFRRAGVPFDARYGVLASPAVAARLRQLEPTAWVYSPDSGAKCLADYLRIGWTSIVPGSCRDTTIVLTLDQRWKIWGWPYRFLDRMTKAGSKVVIYGARREGRLVGLEQPEQYDLVPRSFHGSLWIEDAWTMAPSLRR